MLRKDNGKLQECVLLIRISIMKNCFCSNVLEKDTDIHIESKLKILYLDD